LYRIGFWLLSPFFLFWFLAESLVEGRKVWQRLGFGLPQSQGKKRIWLHASSVGEVNVLALLLPHLQKAFPGKEIIISVFTTAGYHRASILFQSNKKDAKIFYLPLDFGGLMERAFRRLTPSVLIITETELWPELLATAAKKNVPVFLANGTLSAKSAGRYRAVRSVFRSGFLAFRKLLVQTEQDKTSFSNLAIPDEKIKVVGQTKYDLLWATNEVEPLSELKDFFYWVAGSTRPGEEEKILAAHRQLIQKFPNLKLLLAPRHLERLAEIESLVQSVGFSSRRVSAKPDCQIPILTLDKMGVLLQAYAGAQVAFVGGTLVSVGGHNLLEPLSVGVPVIFGPSVENVKEAAERLVPTEIARQVITPEELATAVSLFLEKKTTREEVKRIAQEAFASLGGVSKKTAAIIKQEVGDL